jgi:hypothetical protein
MSEFLPYKLHMAQQPYHLAPIESYWEELAFPAMAMRPKPSSDHPEFDTTIPGLLFRHTATETSYVIAKLPYAWRQGTALKPHVRWQKTTTAAGAVYWQLSYQWAPSGEALQDAVTSGSSTPLVSDADTAGVQALTRFASIDGADRTIRDMLLIKLSRVFDNAADTYAASARLLGFGVLYQVSSPGSRQEFVK